MKYLILIIPLITACAAPDYTHNTRPSLAPSTTYVDEIIRQGEMDRAIEHYQRFHQ